MSDPHAWQSTDDSRATSTPRSMADILFLPESERTLLNWLLRQRTATLAEIAEFLGQSEPEAQLLLESFIQAGFVQLVSTDPLVYQPLLKIQKERRVPNQVWDALK